jgi:putative tryptophan/tyrosine transport system substrate-binding protein
MDSYVRVWKATTRSLSLTYQAFEVRTPAEFGAAFSAIKAAHSGALFVGEGWPGTPADGRRIVEFTIKSKLPAMFVLPGYVEIGGLFAYLASDTERVQRAAALIDKILKGAKPGDLPVEQPTKFEFFINLKTAKALGLTIPPSLLARADQVIE